MKKNILIVTSEFPPQPGGIGNHSYYLGLYLSKNDYTVSVIADQRDVENREERNFDAGLPFSVHRVSLKRIRPFMYVERIVKTFQAFKHTDYVIATGKFSLWNVAFCSLFFKRHKMAVIHGTEVNFKSATLRKTIDLSLKRFDIIVAVSQYTKQLVAHLNRKVEVIPNGIEVSQWKADEMSKGRLKGFPVLTTVGRVSSRKGQLQVIRLLPELKKMYPKIHYHCIGIPTEAEAFLSQAKALGVTEHVTFHGAVDDQTLKASLLATDVFVMLSTESTTGDVEGFGIAILEANALGIPSIGSKGCGIEDAIADGGSGFLVDPQDVADFRNSLNRLLDDAQKFKSQAKTWAEQHDWNQIIKQYLNHLP
ncbi:glycosyltransferase family 4 protein [Gelidibacter maritimus]|uniref:Glycosyltransferase family 4 protein n=1 Tax=Gelidibacter maritimus TaxID=2761487 RepID=A0A7W2M4Q7_9FLAO|nr:glycosyltransferase family 4 protein [Gelidibacter maritimus]MBA6152677.1 glycosyltransferase family 4 protein [Gelidibacter maritimus]